MGRASRRLTYPYHMSPYFTQGKYFFENFKGGQQPFFFKVASGLPALPTAGQGATSYGLSPAGNYYEFFETTAQTLFPTGSAGNGLNIACDLVDNEALEIVPGGNSSSSRLAFTVGTDPDFFFRAKYSIADITGSDQFVMAGFRKQEAFAVPTSILSTGDGVYTDFAGIGFADATGTDVSTVSDLNNSGSTTVTDTGFNATNAEVLQVEIRVIGAKAYYFINGTRLGNPVTKDGNGTAITSQTTLTGATFTFDTGDVLVPFIFLRHDAAVANATYLQEVEIGHLVSVGLDPNNEVVA